MPDTTPVFILIHGNPVDGCEYYGPFSSADDAAAAGEKLQGDWWVTQLYAWVPQAYLPPTPRGEP